MDLTRIGAMFQGLGAAANDYYRLEKQRRDMEYYDQLKQSQLASNQALIESRQQQAKLDRQNEIKGAELMNRTAREQEMNQKADDYKAQVYSKYVQRVGDPSKVSQKDFQVYFMEYSRANQDTPIEVKNWAAKQLMKAGFARADNPPRGPDHSYSEMLNASKAQDSFEKIYQDLYGKRNALISTKEADVKNPANRYEPNPMDMANLGASPKKPGKFVDPKTNKYIGDPAAYQSWYQTPTGAAMKREVDHLTALLKAEVRKAQRLGNTDDAQRGLELINGMSGSSTPKPRPRSTLPNAATVGFMQSFGQPQQAEAPDQEAPAEAGGVEMPSPMGAGAGEDIDAKAQQNLSPEAYALYQEYVKKNKDPQAVYSMLGGK
jgi:hypothetical protein